MAKRDTAVFAEFVAARSPALFRTAYVMVGDHGLAQDLVQEALTKTYVAWPRLREVDKAEAYTRKAITTKAMTMRATIMRPMPNRTSALRAAPVKRATSTFAGWA